METKKKGRRPINTEAFDFIRNQPTKQFVLPRYVWKLVTPPGAHILRKNIGKEYEVRTLMDDSGWLIKRK